MSGQLFEMAAEPRLTPDQQLALDAIRDAKDGLDAGEIGALCHAAHGRHAPGNRCTWCRDRGLQLLRSKALKPLVVRRKSGLYQLRDQKPSGGIDPKTSPIPF